MSAVDLSPLNSAEFRRDDAAGVSNSHALPRSLMAGASPFSGGFVSLVW